MDLTGPHQAAPGEGTERRPAHLAPARLVVAGPPRAQRVAPSTGLDAMAMPAADPLVGIRRRLVLDAAIVLGCAAAIVLVVSMVGPVGPSGGVLGITTDGMATAGTIVGPGPGRSATPGPQGPASAPAPSARPRGTAAPAATPVEGTGASALPFGPSSASLSLLAPCPDRSGCYLYVVRRGDNLTRIASRFGLSPASILALNQAIVDPSIIVTGSTLRLPTPTR